MATGPLQVQLAAAATANDPESDAVPVAVVCEPEDTNRIKVTDATDSLILVTICLLTVSYLR